MQAEREKRKRCTDKKEDKRSEVGDGDFARSTLGFSLPVEKRQKMKDI